ncbi:MAG: hypothetical protein AB1546_11385 [bacterium]
MKRYGNLYEKIISWDNLLESSKKARMNKRYRPNVAEYERDLEKNLVRLREKLLSRTYRPGPYREKIKGYRRAKPHIVAVGIRHQSTYAGDSVPRRHGERQR